MHLIMEGAYLNHNHFRTVTGKLDFLRMQVSADKSLQDYQGMPQRRHSIALRQRDTSLLREAPTLPDSPRRANLAMRPLARAIRSAQRCNANCSIHPCISTST